MYRYIPIYIYIRMYAFIDSFVHILTYMDCCMRVYVCVYVYGCIQDGACRIGAIVNGNFGFVHGGSCAGRYKKGLVVVLQSHLEPYELQSLLIVRGACYCGCLKA